MPGPDKEHVRAAALALGFEACRFTTADPPPHADFFRQWLAQDFQAGMHWLKRQADLRCDPRRVLPAAQSIVFLAASYHPDRDAQPPEPATLEAHGQIARYARFPDYHDTLQPALAELVRWLDAPRPGEPASLAMVDSGPLMERDLAQRAGLGFIGKHTGLIGRNLGNWCFIAAILTPAVFAPDEPEPNRCGQCTRCLTACPTGALPAPFILDARRCIAYLTIEHKGDIPEELRPLIGNRIFGCDDCLAACPWNRFAQASRLMGAATVPGEMDLCALLDMDEAAFKRRFAGTPILRPKWKGFLRNVCIALGNVGHETALPALNRAAASPEPLIASHAAWAIAQIEKRRRQP